MKEIIESTIELIIKEIPPGMVFDTHTIIEYLLQNYSDEYLQNCNGRTTLSYHGYIGQVIDGIAKERQFENLGKSWSLNIHKRFSECTCWRKS